MLFFSLAYWLFVTLQTVLLPGLVVIGLEHTLIALFIYVKFPGNFHLLLVYLLHFLYLFHLSLFLKDHLGPLKLLFDLFSYRLSNIVLLEHFGTDWLEAKAVILGSWGMIGHFLRLAQWLLEWKRSFLWLFWAIVPKDLPESIIGAAVIAIEKGWFVIIRKLIGRDSRAIPSLRDKEYLVYFLHRRVKISNIDELVDLFVEENVGFAALFRKNGRGPLRGFRSCWSGGLGVHWLIIGTIK